MGLIKLGGKLIRNTKINNNTQRGVYISLQQKPSIIKTFCFREKIGVLMICIKIKNFL